MISSLSSEIIVSVDPATSFKTYSVSRVSSGGAGSLKGENEATDPIRFSYRFQIDTSELEFWNYKRKVSEIGIRELMIPVGMKASISEKFKQTFRFGDAKDAGLTKEPEFVKADDYYLLSAELRGEKTLSIQLVPDVAQPENDLVSITYDVSGLSTSLSQPAASNSISTASRPKLDYTSRKNGNLVAASDLLQIRQVEQMADLSKFWLLGNAVLTKMKILQSPSIIASRGELELLKVGEKDVVGPDATRKVDFLVLFEFLESIALSFTPLVRRLKEKTPIKGELILRQELEAGQRKEFTVRLDDLKSELVDTEYGKRISDIIGI
jgi:hypothetical protein